MAAATAGDIPISPAAVNCGSVSSKTVGTSDVEGAGAAAPATAAREAAAGVEVSAGVGTSLLLILLPMLLM
jgi:hypothetical protein